MIPNLYSSLWFFPRLTPDITLKKLIRMEGKIKKLIDFNIIFIKLYHDIALWWSWILKLFLNYMFDCWKLVNLKPEQLIRSLLVILCPLILNACQASTVPLEFAPDGNIVQEAITLQLSQRLTPLSQQLNTQKPRLDISNINVKSIDTIAIANLPTYHLKGTYNLKLILPRQEVKQNKNKFDVYLQRQGEGKTWRLLSKDNKKSSEESSWKSYLIVSQ
jgi:hypothetical protein